MTGPGHEWACGYCGAHYPLAPPRYVCDCPAAGRLDLVLAPAVNWPGPAGERSLWRYADLLPVGPDEPGARLIQDGFPAGGTPLRPMPGLAAELGLAQLWVKDESVNPTGSLKDRATSLVVAAAVGFGYPLIATASSGNAATSLAAAARVASLACVVLVPERASPARIGRIARYGAHVVVVRGDYDAAVRLCFAACDAWGWYCRTTAVNPYTTQGKKTAALELCEQLGRAAAPDVLVVPAGDGNILVGVHRGFTDALRLGRIDRIPRLIAVQAEGAAAITRAVTAGWRPPSAAPAELPPGGTATIAGGIAVGRPLDGARAVAAIQESGGTAVTVPDSAIGPAVARLARHGVHAEPSSAVAAAALERLIADGHIGRTDRVVMINTGRPEPTEEAGRAVTAIPAELPALRALLAPSGVPVASCGVAGTRLSGVSGT